MDDNWEKELDFHYFSFDPHATKSREFWVRTWTPNQGYKVASGRTERVNGWVRELKQISVHNSGFLAPRYFMIYSRSSTFSPSVPWMWMANLTLLLLSIMIELIWKNSIWIEPLNINYHKNARLQNSHTFAQYHYTSESSKLASILV